MTATPTDTRPFAPLVASPVFVLSAIRSGSTLLRCILNTHSEICAPHELHLADLAVTGTPTAAGLTATDAGWLLRDRVLHTLLTRAGKRLIVDKTPGNLLDWEDLPRRWPDARFVFLLRHPAGILDSAIRSRPAGHPVDPRPLVLTYCRALAASRVALPGLTVRYEELTSQPEATTRALCSFLGVLWEPGMCEYGSNDHGPFVFGIGDFTANIRSGRVNPARPHPDWSGLSDDLREVSRQLGYSEEAPTP